MFGVLTFAALCGAASALAMGGGLASPGVAFFGLFVCLLCAAAAALARRGAAAAAIAGRDGRRDRRLRAVRAAGGAAMQVIEHLLLIAVGLGAGLLVSLSSGATSARPTTASSASAALLAMRRRRLLGGRPQLPPHRRQRPARRGAAPTLAGGIGRTPWELPQFGSDDESLDALLRRPRQPACRSDDRLVPVRSAATACCAR